MYKAGQGCLSDFEVSNASAAQGSLPVFTVHLVIGNQIAHMAFKIGCTVTETLSSQGVDLEAADQKGRTALHHAAMHSHLVVAESLLRAGANVGAQDGFASTPLYLAVKSNATSVSQLLLSWKVGAVVKTSCKQSGGIRHL